MRELLRAVIAREAEERERARLNTLKRVIEALKELRKGVTFKRAYIFGSVVKPYMYTSRSDVDIAFEGLEPDKLFYAVAFLSEKIGRDVDVVGLERADPYLRRKIVEEGLEWKPD